MTDVGSHCPEVVKVSVVLPVRKLQFCEKASSVKKKHTRLSAITRRKSRNIFIGWLHKAASGPKIELSVLCNVYIREKSKK